MPDHTRRLTLDELAHVQCIADGLLDAVLTLTAGHLVAGDAVTLTDAEGVTVGRLDVTGVDGTGTDATGTVTVLDAPTPPTYVHLRRAPADMPTIDRPLVALVGVHAPDAADLAQVLSNVPPQARVLGLVAAGGVRPDDAAHHRAVRSWLALERAWSDARPFELALTALWPGAPAATRRAAATAYGARTTHLVETGDLASDTAADTAADTAGPAGATVLFTGLSGSGKSTVASALVGLLTEDALRTVTLLDGDVVRTHLSSELGFTREHRTLNIERIGWVAAEVTKHGGLAVAAPIAPYDATRQAVRAMVEHAGGPGAFVLVHISTPLAECERRDRKGLYAKARRGEIPTFTGISDPYEEPADADLVIDTTSVSADTAARAVLDLLRRRGRV